MKKDLILWEHELRKEQFSTTASDTRQSPTFLPRFHELMFFSQQIIDISVVVQRRLGSLSTQQTPSTSKIPGKSGSTEDELRFTVILQTLLQFHELSNILNCPFLPSNTGLLFSFETWHRFDLSSFYNSERTLCDFQLFQGYSIRQKGGEFKRCSNGSQRQD